MSEKFFAVIVALFATTIFGILIKILTFSNAYKTGSANTQLWIQPDGENKYAETIYEIEYRPKPRHLIKSFYVYSDSAQHWFIQGILFTILQVVLTGTAYCLRGTIIKEVERGEDVFLLMQWTALIMCATWLFFCFKKLLQENSCMTQLAIHTKEKQEN
jgi:hypothetical protein